MLPLLLNKLNDGYNHVTDITMACSASPFVGSSVKSMIKLGIHPISCLELSHQ
jgi:hypothetical protein